VPSTPGRRALRVVVCPDSFKGGPSSRDVASAIRDGWQLQRPDDVVDVCPLADGGEGTLDVLAASLEATQLVDVPGCTGPDGGLVDGRYLRTPDGTAVVELANVSGLPLMARLAPVTATTRGLGEVLAHAVEHGASKIVVALGGSASTDGGWGALRALGLRGFGTSGAVVADGAAGLLEIQAVDESRLVPPPRGGVELLVDVTAPLLGPHGAAVTFGPQKGAGPEDVMVLERALRRWSHVLGGDPAALGSGAAGGTAYGLATVWGARILSGAGRVADLVALDSRLSAADLVVTGEGCFDATSLTGKVVGEVLRRAEGRVAVAVVAGQVAGDVASTGARVVSTSDLAGSVAASMAEPLTWLHEAARQLAVAVEADETSG
jgi:glycerate 2-kinase